MITTRVLIGLWLFAAALVVLLFAWMVQHAPFEDEANEADQAEQRERERRSA